MMKKLLLTIAMCFVAGMGFAQALIDEDYRTAKATGNWSDTDMWEKRTGGVWTITSIAPTAANNVYVQSGHVVTVDVPNAYCDDLQLSITGSLVIGSNIMNVNGKIRAFDNPAVTGAADGIYTTNSTDLDAAMIITTGAGVLKFVGGTRNITNAGEWGNNGTTNAAEFALDPNATGSIPTGVKFRPILISSGIIKADETCSAATGDFTIKSGATFLSTKNGSVLRNNSTTKMGVFTIENNAVLELTGSTPTLDATTIINNGTVVYSRAGTQTLLNTGGDVTSTKFDKYYNLVLGGTSNKTSSVAFTVSNLLDITGTAGLIATTASGYTCTMLNGSTISRSSTLSTPIASASVIILGTTATDLVNLVIGASVSNTGELSSTQAPGKIGTLTINNGYTYTITGSRPITNLVNNGILALTPSTNLTLTVNGDISGSGTITGHASSSITLAGANNGDAGTLKFTTGGQVLNNLSINRTGVNSSVTLGTPLELKGNLTLTKGVVNIQPGQTLSMAGNISGVPFSATNYINTQSSGASIGKFNITNLAASKLIPIGHNGNYLPITLNPTATSSFDISVFEGATADATPNGTALTADQKKRVVDAVWNINRTSGSGNVDVTLGWDNALEGADFAGYTDAQIGIAAYNGTAYGTFTGLGNAANNIATITTSAFSPFVVGEANTTLPLKLLNFNAKASLNSVKLTWQTTSEVNLKNYILQHKGINGFEDIYTVAANNKQGIFNYSYTHTSPVAGVNYYRLIGVDNDGTQHITDPKSVNVALASAVSVYPNPVTGGNINVSGVASGDIIKVLNLQGQVIVSQTVDSNSAQQINIQNIQAGIYILSVENAGKITGTQKVIKL